jgi:hypothetical protein
MLKTLTYELITPEDLYPSTEDRNINLQDLSSFLHPLKIPPGRGCKNCHRNTKKKTQKIQKKKERKEKIP